MQVFTKKFEPAYLKTYEAGLLKEKVSQALGELADCKICPRDCGVNRLEDKFAVCKTGRYAVVSSCFAHFGEEDCLRGTRGSGTIFFSWCNLRCQFCQNWDISQKGRGRVVKPRQLARMMLHLQEQGCHNINFVTPEHVVPQILEALPFAIEGGLRVPFVYNTSAYDSLASLQFMDGIVDIYMPDFKFWDAQKSSQYLRARNYPDAARAALKEMHRQVSDLQVDENGVAVRGLLVRHLVMPKNLCNTREIMRFLASEISVDTFVNIMDQYNPQWNAYKMRGINRPTTRTEWREALQMAKEEGLWRFACA